ncbi:MAG: cytochrome-c peroxidase [Myxococcales bacterium]|nr:cytochrome-c peroxidase [Myxococcales bacterium]MCB9540866.1 cytochrome-c peroxidase [Myxococcales bacterium]MCB9551464.1 cytochrome-c peroxidase [Myxococcales bacterium]
MALLSGCESKAPAGETADKTAAAEKAATAEKAAPAAPAATGPIIDRAMLAAFAPLPEVMADASNPITPEKVELGRMLYYESRISKNHDVSCNTCHALDNFGVDNQKTSPGHKKQLGGRNSPTVYNAAGHIAQFWDGRAATIEEQAKGPVLNPVEMAMPGEAQVLEVLGSMPEYVEKFKAAFPEDADPISYENFARAVGAFERKLVTPGKWDAYLGGDDAALTDDEKKGLKTFIEAGCTACHTGPYLGGHMYQKAGLVKPWPNQADQGRFEVTKAEGDKMMFKVPGLRNIARTSPYFHDGSVDDLGQAVRMMAEHQLGRALTDEQVASIVTFLNALTGEIPKDYIQKPVLPASTDATPKPDPN